MSRSWPESAATNPAGGGYQSISPTILFAHKDANMAVGGGGILSGMSPKGFFDLEGAEQLIAAAKQFKADPPGSVKIHHDATGFFRYVYDTEQGVLDGLKDYMKDMPAYHPKFFRVAAPGRAAVPGRGPLLSRALQPEDDVQLRRSAGAPGGRQRAHGIPAGLRP